MSDNQDPIVRSVMLAVVAITAIATVAMLSGPAVRWLWSFLQYAFPH